MRFIVVVTVLLAMNANNGALGVIAPISNTLNSILNTLDPLTEPLSMVVDSVLNSLQICVNQRRDAQLAAEIESYKKVDRQACCQAEQFPRIFTAFTRLSECFKDVFERRSFYLCETLQLIPGICELGRPLCLTELILTAIFGEIGKALATLIVEVVEPYNPIDGCITSGSTQMYYRIKNRKGNDKTAVYGDSQTPLGAIAGAALGGLFAISGCLPQPFKAMSKAAWDQGLQMVTERCESQIKEGIWKNQWNSTISQN